MPIYNKNKGIMSLMILLTVGFFALGLALTGATGIIKELKKNRDTILGDKSFYTAEAAAREGTYQYINDTSSSGGIPQLLNDTTDVSIYINDDPLNWPYVEVKGDAENNLTYREVIYNLTVFPEGLAFYHAVYSNNALNFGGSAEINGNVFANTAIDFHGHAIIEGNAYSPGTIEENDNITGETIIVEDNIPPPQINLDEYYAVATHVFSSSTEAENYLNGQTIPGPEIIIVEDTQTNLQTANLTGSLVVTGNLRLSGGTVINVAENYAAVVVLGDLRITGGVTINGIVYVLGATSFGGGTNVINGSLISAREINYTDLTGNVEINFDPEIAANWTGLLGLETTSTSTPRIIGWSEQ